MNATVRRWVPAAVLAVFAVGFAGTLVAAAAGQRDANRNNPDADARRPKLTLKAQPTVAIAPARVVFTVDLSGGSNDFEEYYCPTVSWAWGDGTESESTSDCQPYEAGKSEIKRRYTVQHVFRAGGHQVTFRLKRNDKTLISASVNIQIQPGGPEGH
jgi:hypothetical protein